MKKKRKTHSQSFYFCGNVLSALCVRESHVGTLPYFTLMTIWPLLGSHWILTMGRPESREGGGGFNETYVL